MEDALLLVAQRHRLTTGGFRRDFCCKRGGLSGNCEEHPVTELHAFGIQRHFGFNKAEITVQLDLMDDGG